MMTPPTDSTPDSPEGRLVRALFGEGGPLDLEPLAELEPEGLFELGCRDRVERHRRDLTERVTTVAELLDSAPLPAAEEFERLAAEVAERRERLADSLTEVVAPAAGLAAEVERLLAPARRLLGEARTAADLAERLEFAEEDELENLSDALDALAELDTGTAPPELAERLGAIREARSLARQHLEAVRRLECLRGLHCRLRRLERCRLRPVPRATDHPGGAPPPEPRRSPKAANAPPSSATRARTAALAA